MSRLDFRHRWRLLPPLLASIGGLLGCAASTPSFGTIALKGASAPAVLPPAKARSFVVWAGKDGAQTSRLLSVTGGTVTELGETDGAIMVWEDHAYQFVAEESEAPLYACDPATQKPPELAEKAIVHRGELVELGTKARILISPASDTSGMNEYDDSVDLQASLGPFVFVSSGEWGYGCGAHGNWSRSSLIWDLHTQKPVELLSMSERQNVDSAERSEARDALDNEARFGPGEPLALEDTALVEEVPTYEKGLIGLNLHFVASACYACSDGEWSSYSRSALVPARTLPSAIGRFAKPLTWLGSYAARHPNESIGGVSEVSSPREVPGLIEAMHPVRAATKTVDDP